MPSREKLVQSVPSFLSSLCKFEYGGVRFLESEKKEYAIYQGWFFVFFFGALRVIKNLFLHTEFGIPSGR